jgi:cystathionine beta-lyase/cystathionine gamma-synthase
MDAAPPDRRVPVEDDGDRRRAERVVPLDKPARPVPPGPPAHPIPLPQQAVEAALAAREGTEAAILLASDAAALACTLLAMLRQGDHVVADEAADGPAREFLTHELPLLGVATTLVPPGDARAWRQALRPTTRLLVVTCPDDADPERRLVTPRVLARDSGVVLVAIAVPGSAGALSLLGADVVVRALPAGPGDAWAGLVGGADAVVDEVRLKALRWGATASAATVRAVAAALGVGTGG